METPRFIGIRGLFLWKMINTCAVCQKNFYVRPSDLSKGKGKTCSRKCFFVTRLGTTRKEETKHKISKAKKGKKLSQEHITSIQKSLQGRISGFRERRHTLSSKMKNSQAHVGLLKGEKHWNWKGGISSLDERERSRFRKTIKKFVFERDNYTCQHCKNKGGFLHVDHIKRWSEYTKERFNMKNCRTLCRRCHYMITYKKPLREGSSWGTYKGGQELCVSP